MIAATELRGVCAAVLTPFDEAYRPDASLAIPYYADLLARGCDALNVLGTTGEAMSIATADRLRFMEAVAQSDLPRGRIMTGTGAAAINDAIGLTRAAFDLGFAAALVMPPFFFRDASDDGVLRFFDRLVRAVDPPAGGILLYNFPKMSGVTFSAPLVMRLVEAFPDVIGGLKDSSNDERLQDEIARAHPQLAVFPSSEEAIARARARGFAGCISGSVALWPELAARAWLGDMEAQTELSALRRALAGAQLIAAVRGLVAEATGQTAWKRTVPPL